MVSRSGVPCGGEFGDIVGEPLHLVEALTSVERDDEVQSARAGGHRGCGQGEFVQQRAQHGRGRADRGEVVVRWVEVEHQPVGVVGAGGAVGAGQPAVRGDTGLVGEEEEGDGVVAPPHG
ncbi:hypothetical protein SRO_1400 [Streptomyces rochei]|nr:hypothetical protein SRO_1400 [Streptomyces rochei]